jgi:hypothetical protein
MIKIFVFLKDYENIFDRRTKMFDRLFPRKDRLVLLGQVPVKGQHIRCGIWLQSYEAGVRLLRPALRRETQLRKSGRCQHHERAEQKSSHLDPNPHVDKRRFGNNSFFDDAGMMRKGHDTLVTQKIREDRRAGSRTPSGANAAARPIVPERYSAGLPRTSHERGFSLSARRGQCFRSSL